jgi:ribosome-binding factor A
MDVTMPREGTVQSLAQVNGPIAKGAPLASFSTSMLEMLKGSLNGDDLQPAKIEELYGKQMAGTLTSPCDCVVAKQLVSDLYGPTPFQAPSTVQSRGGFQRTNIRVTRSKKSNSAPPSQRQLRVGELVRHKLAEMLARGDIHDDVIASHVITVPEVRLSPDLKLATAYVVTLGDSHTDAVIEALNRNKRFIRAEVAHAVNLKFAPDIRFRRDETFEEASRIDQLLASQKARQDVDKG